MYTSHGHHITGASEENQPTKVTRCGGAGLCSLCSQEIAAYTKSLSKPESKNTPQETFGEAIRVVETYIKKHHNRISPILEVLSFNRTASGAECLIVCSVGNLYRVEIVTGVSLIVSEYKWVQSESF